MLAERYDEVLGCLVLREELDMAFAIDAFRLCVLGLIGEDASDGVIILLRATGFTWQFIGHGVFRRLFQRHFYRRSASF